eukprot:scaffold9114_cov66-Phaeocystis_antarctica.AAC.1
MRCAMTPGFAGAGRSGKRSSTIDVNHDVLEEVVCEVVEEREWRLHPCALAGLCWAAGAASIVIDTCLSRGRIARFILLAGVLPRHWRRRHSSAPLLRRSLHLGGLPANSRRRGVNERRDSAKRTRQ